MKRRMRLVRVGLWAVLLLQAPLAPLAAAADAAAVPDLVFREIKITGDEFVVLQATTDIDHLSEYWLGYSSDEQATTIVPTQQLPDVPLLAGQAVLLTSDGTVTCDAVYTTKLAPSLGDTGGRLELRHLTSDPVLGTSIFQTIDDAYWTKPSKTAPALTDNDEMDIRQEAAAVIPVWYRDPVSATTPWQVGSFADCTLTFTSGSTTLPPATVTWPQNDTDPPATIESLADDDTAITGPVLPAGDAGLTAPQITELLPNPAGTGNDATDEFVELYNPNTTAFDLSGFTLETGLSTKHSYTFPAGTSLPPKSFVAFRSADTGLSLSNTSSQADLLDPFGTVIAQTDPYSSAKDGLTWALAKGTWYWTTHATPSSANVIAQVATTSKIKQTSTSKTTAVKGASTAKPATTVATTSTKSAAEVSAPIHPGMLAAVVVLGLGYGVYEYRHDLANRIYQFRSNRAARRKARG
jgi:hypothetical protein